MRQSEATVGGRYTILKLVGHGGMGTVYCARDERLGREVTIKVLRADLAADPAARARFLREGHIAAQIVHPNVVRTYDAGDDPAGPYLVQEFVTGQTLEQVMPLPPGEAAKIIRAIAAALAHIHGRGYIHCDVKPQNILLRDNGAPVLLDFGIARAEGADTTTLIATPHYLAPERAKGEPPTAAADLYALGIVLYQTVAGDPPFDAPNVHAIIQQHIETPVPPLALRDPTARVLDRVIARPTAKRPEDRYDSVGTLQSELAAVEDNAIHAQPTIHMAAPATNQPVQAARPMLKPQTITAAWSAAPAWRRRRWIATIIIPLLLLLLVYGIALAGGEQENAAPGATAQPRVVDPEALRVPEVVGLEVGAAEERLRKAGLVAERGAERPGPEAAGIVVASEPGPATPVARGATVVLYPSRGPAPTDTPLAPSNAAEPPQPPAPPADGQPPEDAGEDASAGNQRGEGRGQNNGRNDKGGKGNGKDSKEAKENKDD